MCRLENAGFEHYEISNFARPGFRSRHNSSYWKGIPYLGCGPSAHSFDGRNRQWNHLDLNVYIDQVGKCLSSEDFNRAPWIEQEELNLYERYNDCIITSLRTSDGLNLSELKRKFGQSLTDYCRCPPEKRTARNYGKKRASPRRLAQTDTPGNLSFRRHYE